MVPTIATCKQTLMEQSRGARFQAQTFRGECRKPLAMPLHGQVVDGDVLPVRIAKIAPASMPNLSKLAGLKCQIRLKPRSHLAQRTREDPGVYGRQGLSAGWGEGLGAGGTPPGASDSTPGPPMRFLAWQSPTS
jgi:hypothetical protein